MIIQHSFPTDGTHNKIAWRHNGGCNIHISNADADVKVLVGVSDGQGNNTMTEMSNLVWTVADELSSGNFSDTFEIKQGAVIQLVCSGTADIQIQ